MPRFARIHIAGGLFHVISRFHDRRFYLDIEGAREKYLELLGKAAETHDCRILAYCLMSSHVHLVLQLGNAHLGKLTKKVNSPFATWVNGQRKGLGTVVAGLSIEDVDESQTEWSEPGRRRNPGPCVDVFCKTQTQREV